MSPELWGVALGGILAALSGAGTQWFTSWLNARAAWELRREDKFEELLTAFYANSDWFEKVQKRYLADEAVDVPTAPCMMMTALAAMYFPALSGVVEDYAKETMKIHSVIAQANTDKKIKGQFDENALMAHYSPYLDSETAVLATLLDYAHANFGSARPAPKPPPRSRIPTRSS